MDAKNYRYPLRMPGEDSIALNDLVKESGHSINDVLLLAIRKGLPLAREALKRDTGRITNVDPLPDKVWRRIYSRPDEMSKVTGKQLAASQIQTEPE